MALHHTTVVSAARVDGPDAEPLADWRARSSRLHLDLGCGDAHFAHREALGTPDLAVVGIDTCLDNVRIRRKAMPPNLRLLQADARDMAAQPALRGAGRITVNFPYGSLLRWIVDDTNECIDVLTMVAATRATLEIRINASALREIGAGLEDVTRHLGDAFARRCDWSTRHGTMDQAELRAFPSTWARRIGSGREATALEVVARRAE